MGGRITGLLGAAALCAMSAVAAQESAPVVTRFEAEIEMQRLTAARQLAEAAAIGQQLLPLTEAEFGADSREAADAYAAVAAVQNQLGDYPAAEQGYLHALAIYREVEGAFAPVLVAPLLALGDNYHDAGQYENAIAAYGEARTVSRRVNGLLSELQIEMLDRLTASFERLDDLGEAHARQVEALALVERNHDAAAPEVFAAIYKYGAWLRGVFRYTEERDQYLRAERTIRDTYGDSSPLLVRPLRERANSFRVQGSASGQGISALRDALEIVEAEPEPDSLQLAEVLRDIGDWEVAFGRLDTESAEYLRSWHALAEVPNGEQLRKEWYADVEFVLKAPLNRRGLSNDPAAPSGHVLVRFDIDQYGRSRNVAVVASEPPGLKDDSAVRYIRESRFRPNIVDGQLVTTSNRGLDIVFRYIVDEDEQEQD